MKLLQLICLLLPFRLATSLPARQPVTSPYTSDVSISKHKNIETRQLQVLAAIINVVTGVISLVEDIFDTLANPDEAESKFTTETVVQLAAQFPHSNILIYHDQHSDVSGLVNDAHQHVEFSLGILDFTKGYEIHVFDYGTFYRAGDGGYQNWCTMGEFEAGPVKGELIYYDF